MPKWVAKALVAMLWGALCGVILFIGSTVRANDNKATTEHTAIRKEVRENDDGLRKELMNEVTLLRTEQKVMRQDMSDGFTEVLVAIAEIKK